MLRQQSGHLIFMIFAMNPLLFSCGQERSTEDTSQAEASVSDFPLCSLQSDGKQSLNYSLVNHKTGSKTAVDTELAFSYSWNCEDGQRKLTGTGVPNHVVTGGEFATSISAQTVSQSVSLSPEQAGQVTSVRESGYALNSVKFEPGTAGTCPDSAGDDTTCDYGAGRDTWKMVALPGEVSPWKFSFGTDRSNAHTQPTGAYHYHGMPEELILKLNKASTTSMTMVGWAVDGFPIYARYGYQNAFDVSSSLKKIKSSYQKKSLPDSGRPSVDLIPMGHFEQDWEYVEGSGDLDECNGRSGPTPEFPKGIYHYYITETYPFIQRCIKGTASQSQQKPASQGPPPR